ncbi:Imm1 family immunity protein [Streptomyces rubiginosohelvolus]|uniref:Imm1 family immunity protein n=1 Tax=Streptomyces TaxID=1883 RepID=UPI0027E0D7CF|nr:Imm1 family immunity protein [Streptomyces sp. 7G]
MGIDARANSRNGDTIVIVAGGTHAGSIYARSEEEIVSLIDHIMSDLLQGGRTPEGFEIMPEHATVTVIEDGHSGRVEGMWPSSYLHVSVNTSNGYGALRWFSTTPPSGGGGDHINGFVWVSENPNPPTFDPKLILDSSTPLYYPRESAFPVAKVREGLEEFCRARSGERPECIPWMVDQHTV